MIEIQKTRIHDIVHGAFLGLNSLIPNPIKASIRKAIRDHIGGKSSDEQISDPSKAMKAVETDKTNTDIRKQQEKIRKIDEPKFKQLMINNNKNKKNLSKSNSNRINSKEIVDDITKKYFSDSKMKYLTFNFILDYEQQDNYYDANGSEKLDENEELSIMNSGVRRPF